MITGVDEHFESLANFQKEFGRIYRRDFTGAKRVVLNTQRPGFLKRKYPGDWKLTGGGQILGLWQGRHGFKSLRLDHIGEVQAFIGACVGGA